MAEWPMVKIKQGFTYVQSGSPSGAVEGETWFDTDTAETYVYDGSTWVTMSANDHSELSGVGSSDHHSRPSPGANMTEDANGNFDVSLPNSTQSSGGHQYSSTPTKHHQIKHTITNVADGATASGGTTAHGKFADKLRIHADSGNADWTYLDIRDESGNWIQVRSNWGGGTFTYDTTGWRPTGIRGEVTNTHSSYHLDYTMWIRYFEKIPASHSHNL